MKRLLSLVFMLSASFSPVAFAADPAKAESKSASAIFAGGCFWCMQPPYDALKGKGVISTRVGYTGGSKRNPTYQEVSSGTSGHKEVIEVVYDPAKISYEALAEIFWKNVDPFDGQGQFCDKGPQYASAIYFRNDSERKAAEATRDRARKLAKGEGSFATEILPVSEFFAAEDYHQAYYEKNPIRYKYYRGSCGRDRRLKEVWGSSAPK